MWSLATFQPWLGFTGRLWRRLLCICLLLAALLLPALAAASAGEGAGVGHDLLDGRADGGTDGGTDGRTDGWTQEPAATPFRRVLVGEGGAYKLELYHQPLPNGPTFDTFWQYSARSILNEWNGLTLLAQEERRIQGRRAVVLDWQRPALPLAPDRSRYRAYFLAGGDEAHLVLLKSTPDAFPEALARTEALLPHLPLPDGQGGRQPVDGGADRPQPPLPLPYAGLVWGIFDHDFGSVPALEADLGKPFGVIMTYQAVGKPFPAGFARRWTDEGRLLLLTLHSLPNGLMDTYEIGATRVFDIISGRADDDLRRWAQEARAFGRPFFFRLDNEMNGDLCPWSAYQYGMDTDLYIAAWQRVHRIFQEEGATNALFVWNPNDVSYPNFTWNHSANYYPGGAFVDWVGMTGYNAGSAYGDEWRDFYDIYKPIYDEYRELYPTKPLLITEFASHDGGGDKAQWIREAFYHLQVNFPAIRIAVWWNGTDGRRNYRLDSTPAALTAFREGLLHPYFVSVVPVVPGSA